MQVYGLIPEAIIMKGANIRLNKVILTVSALLVSAAMVFSFAGCTKEDTNTPEDNSGAAVVTEADSAAAVNGTEADTNA